MALSKKIGQMYEFSVLKTICWITYANKLCLTLFSDLTFLSHFAIELSLSFSSPADGSREWNVWNKNLFLSFAVIVKTTEGFTQLFVWIRSSTSRPSLTAVLWVGQGSVDVHTQITTKIPRTFKVPLWD